MTVSYGHTHCSICQEYMKKWVEVYELGNMCITCAQNMMRVIFEDIIKYHNKKSVSLLDILLLGEPDGERMLIFWLGERFLEFYPEKEDIYNFIEGKALQNTTKHTNSDHLKETDIDIYKHRNCTMCNSYVEKWIDVYPSATLCADCAQYTVRTMFEDIIEYHNGTRVSLENIMYYGKSEIIYNEG